MQDGQEEWVIGTLIQRQLQVLWKSERSVTHLPNSPLFPFGHYWFFLKLVWFDKDGKKDLLQLQPRIISLSKHFLKEAPEFLGLAQNFLSTRWLKEIFKSQYPNTPLIQEILDGDGDLDLWIFKFAGRWTYLEFL